MKEYTSEASVMNMEKGNKTTDIHTDDFKPYISIIFIAVVSILINSVVFYVVIRNKKLRQRMSNKFVLNLTASNICVATTMLVLSSCTIGLNIDEHTVGEHSEPAPEISLMFGVLLLLSVMSMIVLSADRLFAVKWTFKYFQLTNSRKVNIVIVIPWIISILYFLILLMILKIGGELVHDHVTHAIYFSFDVIALVGFVTLIVSNLVIYKEAQGQLTHIRRNSVVDTSRLKRKGKTFDLRERRLAFINIGLVVKFVVFWLPTLGTMNYHLIWEMSVSTALEFLSFYLVLTNSICDPTVYVFLSRDIRKAIQRWLLRITKTSNSDQLRCVTDEMELDTLED